MIKIRINQTVIQGETLENVLPVLHGFFKISSPVIYQIAGEWATFSINKRVLSCDSPFYCESSNTHFRVAFSKEGN